MFNIEGPIVASTPFNGCPKIKQVNQNDSLNEEAKKELVNTIKCCHTDGLNFSLGGYKRCVECPLEELVDIMPHFIK